MTVQARRYGRWCREHFDVVAAEGVPAPRAADAAEAASRAQGEPEPARPVVDQPQQG
jgi:hypothetical protein